MTEQPYSYRWLGVAGLEFSCNGYSVLVDPFFTRPPLRALLFGQRMAANQALVDQYTPPANAVLVTHPHYDHLMDVPAIMRRTGACAFGSPNTCVILDLHEVPRHKIHCTAPGQRLQLGPFVVDVFPARHTSTPLDRWLNGVLSPDLRLPLRLRDYKMDHCFSYRITAQGHSALVGFHPEPADTLFFAPYYSQADIAGLLQAVSPQRVVPIHWEDFSRPLTRPLRPMLVTPSQGLTGFPPIRPLNIPAFAAWARSLCPGMEVSLPEIFQSYPLKR
jgi:L-ascorbate metabolism protein UlaG (beta-lactamase superfamily)